MKLNKKKQKLCKIVEEDTINYNFTNPFNFNEGDVDLE